MQGKLYAGSFLYIISLVTSVFLIADGMRYQIPGLQDVLVDELHMPIDTSDEGIDTFIKKVFNHPRYAHDVLAHDFSHLTQILERGKTVDQKRAYYQSIIRLFSNKLKSTPFVNPYALLSFLHEFGNHLSGSFVIFKMADVDPAQTLINDLLCSSFMHEFESFKQSPKFFLSGLSKRIVDDLNTRYDIARDISTAQLRKVILLFLDSALSKLVWSASEGMETWDLCKGIADVLAVLVEKNLIDDPDDLNSLYITLLERYCYFLDIAQDDLQADFFEKIKHDIMGNEILLLTLEESEDSLETKEHRFMRAIVHGHARARAKELGVI